MLYPQKLTSDLVRKRLRTTRQGLEGYSFLPLHQSMTNRVPQSVVLTEDIVSGRSFVSTTSLRLKL